MFDWADVRCFLAVARHGSTLAAARALGVNQTTAARRIESLEAALKVRLFDRGQSGSRLTDAGSALLPAAEALEAAAEAFGSQAAAQARGLTGMVRVTTNEATANLILIPALADFRRLYPDIQVQMLVDDRRLDLMKGEADIAVRGTLAVDDPALISRRVADVFWAVYASRSYVEARGRPQTVDDLNHHDLVGCQAMSTVPAVAWLREQAPHGKITSDCTTVYNMFQAIRAGLGCAPLPTLVGAADPDLVRCMDAPGQHGVYMLTTPALRDAPRVRAFIDFMAPHLQTHIRALNAAR